MSTFPCVETWADHISTHEALNNATYADGSKEISFNKVWLQHSGISAAKYFSPNGLIPPAITGMHNADVIKAWMDNGIKFVVGDNTRPPLFDTVSSSSRSTYLVHRADST
jgi:hypothetical protein